MPLPNEPVTLSPEQVDELRKKLGTMRHDINNHLSLIVAAAELIKINPDAVGRMSATLSEQPAKISAHITAFSTAVDKLLGIKKD